MTRDWDDESTPVTPSVQRAAEAIDPNENWSDGLRALRARHALTTALDVEEIARVLVLHTRADAGRCTCGYAGPVGSSFAFHQAEAIRAMILQPAQAGVELVMPSSYDVDSPEYRAAEAAFREAQRAGEIYQFPRDH